MIGVILLGMVACTVGVTLYPRGQPNNANAKNLEHVAEVVCRTEGDVLWTCKDLDMQWYCGDSYEDNDGTHSRLYDVSPRFVNNLVSCQFTGFWVLYEKAYGQVTTVEIPQIWWQIDYTS